MARLPLSPGSVRDLLGEVEASSGEASVLAIGGATELARALRRALLEGGGDERAVRVGDPENATVYVHVLVAGPTEEDEAVLRRAARARVPVLAVPARPLADDVVIPYVLATDVVPVEQGRGFPLDALAAAVAARLQEDAATLAARLPLLREPVCEQLITTFARRNALLAAAGWVSGPDLPVLALNQIRLVLRLAQTHGEKAGRERLSELAATLGVGFGLRALAREALAVVPVAGWVLRGTVSYVGTRAVGEAARRRFELVAAAVGGPAMPQPAAAVRGAP
jgi:uncharacterized protein (DUF697 family)